MAVTQQQVHLLEGREILISSRGDEQNPPPITCRRMDDIQIKVESLTNSIPALKVSSEIGLSRCPLFAQADLPQCPRSVPFSSVSNSPSLRPRRKF
jgi:hypothetical protein